MLEPRSRKKEIIDDRYGTRTHNLGLRRATRYHCANRPVLQSLLMLYENHDELIKYILVKLESAGAHELQVINTPASTPKSSSGQKRSRRAPAQFLVCVAHPCRPLQPQAANPGTSKSRPSNLTRAALPWHLGSAVHTDC